MADAALAQLLNDRSRNWWFSGFLCVPLNGLIVPLSQQSYGEPQTEYILGHKVEGLIPININNDLPQLVIEFESVICFQSVIESFYYDREPARRVFPQDNTELTNFPSLYNIFEQSPYLQYSRDCTNGMFEHDRYRLYQIITRDHIIEVVALKSPIFRWDHTLTKTRT